MVEPTCAGAAIRYATTAHSPTLSIPGTEMVAKQMFDRLTNELSARGLAVDSVLLRIQLPATLKASIEAKQQAAPEALAMNFRLQKETQEAQRNELRRKASATFSRLSPRASVTTAGMERKGIEATENLAKTANSKVVAIGNNKNGLPLIVGQ